MRPKPHSVAFPFVLSVLQAGQKTRQAVVSNIYFNVRHMLSYI